MFISDQSNELYTKDFSSLNLNYLVMRKSNSWLKVPIPILLIRGAHSLGDHPTPFIFSSTKSANKSNKILSICSVLGGILLLWAFTVSVGKKQRTKKHGRCWGGGGGGGWGAGLVAACQFNLKRNVLQKRQRWPWVHPCLF